MPWFAKNYGGYDRESSEAKANADAIASILVDKGWSINAVSAILGNLQGESGLNPWRWEGDYLPSVQEYQYWDSEEAQYHGYGLFQFTPASKYINNAQGYDGYAPNFYGRSGSPSDGKAQINFFDDTADDSWLGGLYDYYYPEFMAIGVDISAFYFLTFDEFKSSSLPPAQLAGAFELKYERPSAEAGASSYGWRAESANYWYEYFEHHPPTPPTPTQQKHHFKFYLYGGTRRGY